MEEIETRIADIIYNGIETYGSLSDMPQEVTNSVMANFIAQSQVDPDFEGKLSLLEDTSVAIGVSSNQNNSADSLLVSQKGYHGYMIEISPEQLADTNFSILDVSLEQIANFQLLRLLIKQGFWMILLYLGLKEANMTT